MSGNKAYRILILGGGFSNKGAEAMLRVVQREISQRLDDVVCYAYVHREQVSLASACGILPVALGNDRLGKICGIAISERWAVYKAMIAAGDVKRLIHDFRLNINNSKLSVFFLDLSTQTPYA